MSTHKAAVLPAKFAQLEIRQLTTPKPAADYLLIKVHSAAFNPVDYKIQRIGRFFETFPRVYGGDVAGTVESVGEGVTAFKAGDRVLAYVPYHRELPGQPKDTDKGGFQQYTIVLPHATTLVPEHVSFDEASTIPLAFCTVADGFYDFLGLERPPLQGSAKAREDWILIWGGMGSVGQYAVQLAHQSGYKVITTASSAGHSHLKSLGADICLDYKDADVVAQILKATSGGKLKLAYDAVADDKTIPMVLDCLPDGGKAAFVQKTPENALGDKKPPTNIEFTRVFAGKLLAGGSTLGEYMFQWIGRALEDGRLKPNPVELRSGGLEGVQGTLDYYAENGIRGKKFVMRPFET